MSFSNGVTPAATPSRVTVAPGGLLVMDSFSAATGAVKISSDTSANAATRAREAKGIRTSREGWNPAGTLPHIYVALLSPEPHPTKPGQCSTGSRGYLGNCASVALNSHSKNDEPRAEVIWRACRHVAQSPAGAVCGGDFS